MQSIWSESCKFRKREVLDKDIKTDTIIIGAGMAGILIGYMLKQNGIDVILIDAAEMASGNTKNTTAKITSQHDLIYDKLISEFGEKKARQYAKANELAIKKYKEIIKERKIDCEFEEKSAYVYSLNEVENIKKEVEELLEYIKSSDQDIVIVSNEIGMGIVPAYALGRHFRDICGRMNQIAAAKADEAYFVVSGIKMKLK